MAGDWIKLEAATPDKPEIYAIAGFLNCSHGDAFLACVRLWLWADQQSRSCHDLGVTKTAIDRIGGVTGLADALVKARWLEERNGAFYLPNFDRLNGKTAKERALTSKRQVTKRSRSERDKNVTREEKRRELKLIPPSPPEGINGNGDGAHRGATTAKAERKKSATRPPESFEVTEEMWAWAQEQGVPHQRIEGETAKFLDHHRAKGSVFSDWPAAWRKWMRNVVDFAARAH